MKYLSLFSGIESFSQAVHDFGWTCVGVSEIDPFACAVLAHHYPNVPNLGDITKITKEKLDAIKQEHGTIDIVVGGSPCQSFSVAGLRKGLEDPRGNLMLEYIRIVATIHPKWFIWENVTGVLSSKEGADFGTLLQAMAQFGYSLGWRVLDAKYFGIPQKRRRVFLVGSLNKKDGSFKVLFECQSGKGHLKKSRKTGQSDPPEAKTSIREHGQARGKRGEKEKGKAGKESQKIMMFNPSQPNNDAIETDKSVSLIARMGTGGNQVPLIVEEDKVCYYEHHPNDSRVKESKDVACSITARYGTGGGNVPLVVEHEIEHYKVNSKVRKLTPIECERLQGFPDNYTQIPYKKKKAEDCPDYPRYKALGNSMAVPVMRWIACRIALVDQNYVYKQEK